MSFDTLKEELDWACRPMICLPSVFFEDFSVALDKLAVMLEEDAEPNSNALPTPNNYGPEEEPAAEPDAEVKESGDGWSGKLNDFGKWVEDLSKHFPGTAESLSSLMAKIQKTRAQPTEILRALQYWAEKIMYPSIKKRTGYLSKQWELITSFKSRLQGILK